MAGDIAVVLNPGSGGGDAQAAADKIVALFEAAGKKVRIRIPRNAVEIASLARDAADAGAEAVVAAGGDGSVSAVAGALAGSLVPLGVLPVGTLNHFARDLGIPTELEDAVRLIVSGQTIRVDVGEVNGRTFINNCSLGLYPLSSTSASNNSAGGTPNGRPLPARFGSRCAGLSYSRSIWKRTGATSPAEHR